MNDTAKAIVNRKFDEVVQTWDFGVLDEIIGDDMVVHDPLEPQPLRGKDAYRAAAESYAKAFPRIRVTVHEQIAEGDSVVTRWTITGRHEGDLFGIPATGNDIELTGIDIHRVRDGKIVEEHSQCDSLGLMRQLGVVPS